MRLHLLDVRWAARWGRSSTRISRPNWLSSSKRSCASFLSVAAGRAEDLQLPASTMTSWTCFFISLYRSIENVREHVEKRIWANSRAATQGKPTKGGLHLLEILRTACDRVIALLPSLQGFCNESELMGFLAAVQQLNFTFRNAMTNIVTSQRKR